LLIVPALFVPVLSLRTTHSKLTSSGKSLISSNPVLLAGVRAVNASGVIPCGHAVPPLPSRTGFDRSPSLPSTQTQCQEWEPVLPAVGCSGWGLGVPGTA